MLRFRVPIAAATTLMLVAACSSSPSVSAPHAPVGKVSSTPTPPAGGGMPPTPAGSGNGTDWPTFGRDNARSGVAPGFHAPASPKIGWRKKLDGAVYGQPLVIGTTVFAGTENDTVYALSSATGAVLWSKHLGTPVPQSDLPCGDIDPLGITGTMAYDQAAGRVYAVAETTGGAHTLYGLDGKTGAIALKQNVDPPKGDRIAHQQRSALTLLNGRVYVAYGGLAGDCAHYIGSVVSIPATGTGKSDSYAIPTSREGGIWAPGGGVVAPSGDLLFASGNGAELHGSYDGSDSVIALDPATLKLTDRFSPSTWQEDNQQDLDLGSMSPAVVGDFVLADGKRGTAYVLRGDHFGGVGGQVASADVCKAFGAAAVNGDHVYVPCTDGTREITIGADGRITKNWQAKVPANGSPMLGGGYVWVVDWNAGTLYALDPANGSVHSHVDLGAVPHFASPTLSGGTIFVGTSAGVVAVR
jgi:polyvinyl alcohol dehydrogenase (cytochrome)